MNSFKKCVCLIVLSFLLLFIGCSDTNINNMQNVILAPYDNIEISEEYIKITNEEINSIINLDMSYNQYYKKTEKDFVEINDIVLISIACDDDSYNIDYEYFIVGQEELNTDIDNYLLGKKVGNEYILNTSLEEKELSITLTLHGIYTNFDIGDEENICIFYGFDTMDKVRDFLRNRAQKEIIFDYMWKKVLTNSQIVCYPDEITKQLQKNSETNFYSESSNSVFENSYDILSYYNEILIAESILKNENQIISDDVLNNKINQISDKNNISREDVANYFSDQDVYYITLMDEVKKILVSKAIIK